MEDIDWNIIFKLKEFCGHLCNNDLIQLSMSSKKSRKLSAKNIFKTLNLCPFVINSGYSSSVIKEDNCGYGFKIYHIINPYKSITSELTECKKAPQKRHKKINGNTKNLVFGDSRGHFYLLNEIPSIFPNITTLVLKDSVFTMEVLQNLLINLKYLENLDLTENVIFKDATISNEYSISYPISLISLKLGENGVIMIQDKFNPISIKKIRQDSSRTHEFNGTYQHLPNLVTFDYDVSYDYPEENGDLFQFIILNPQLKSLKLLGSVFNYELFDIIKDYENLTHLEYKCEYWDEELDDYEIPILYNIKHLHILVDRNNIYDMIEDKFPNVEELIIEFSWCNCNEKYRLIQRFPKLKYLKFISNRKSQSAGKLTLPKLSNLEKLEINLNYEEGKFEDVRLDVSACDKLKFFSITKSEYFSPFQKIDHAQVFENNWNYIYFPHKLFFSKNS
ncbi:hypothetical protein CONCODRAFT_13183 [Conidiobolus coronatus NRRL 28638]|uniref:F-box domain-containing protein n=1 Tax=Conidiobolus coronatus (strain ATCC 28846 / CBS 209.66 / NRRL 28638) TaxID=796925 RepID=A0A137NRC3_CONC2|nr:hypothetical protein CONCODRAFT_13183 [Conidiobolus coronatus NRRL 28638]|eukprot:KXN65285.1 hypothetical protein CONCODRAFT_13183 [Conidiobolus coronatus NRRL 28638]